MDLAAFTLPPTPELASSCDIRTVQELLSHKDVKITMIYIHFMNRGDPGVVSLLD